ncbi:MAG: TlpA family protein disulfide reductase [Dehalococcoidia bacterium]
MDRQRIVDGQGSPPASREAEPADLEDDTELTEATEQTPSTASSERQRRWYRRALSIGVVALIGFAIWYLQWGPGLPGLGGSTQSAIPSGAGFVSFESQGIELGAAGGEAPKIGRPAPDFTLLDLDGQPLSLSDLRGKTVVMNFWATWCPPCRKEFPELVRLYDRNADRGLVVLGMDLQENPRIVRSFADEFGARFPIVIDTKGDVAARYRLIGLPTTYFIDAEGVIRAQHIGLLNEELLTEKLNQAGFTVTSGQ